MPAPRQALRGPCSLLVICAHANLHSMFRTSCAPSAHAHRCGVLLYVHAYVNCAYPVAVLYNCTEWALDAVSQACPVSLVGYKLVLR